MSASAISLSVGKTSKKGMTGMTGMSVWLVYKLRTGRSGKSYLSQKSYRIKVQTRSSEEKCRVIAKQIIFFGK